MSTAKPKSNEEVIAQWNESLHTLTITEAAKKLGMSRTTLGDLLARAAKRGIEIAGRKSPGVRVPTAGRSLDEFRSSYDRSYIVPRKIKDALVKLADGWLREVDFAKLAGVSPTDLAAYRAEFEEDHVVALTGADRGKRAWAGTKRVATKMREMVS